MHKSSLKTLNEDDNGRKINFVLSPEADLKTLKSKLKSVNKKYSEN